jgi:excisionase family DNA binding protein
MERGLLRVEEAARFLNLGRSKTYQLVASGELPVVRIGKSVRVPARALERWIEERTADGAAEQAVGGAA